MNSLTLAYLGDSIYEVYIRKYLINKGIIKVGKLQKEATCYVSAKNQAKFLKKMLEDNILTDEEKEIVKTARNNKSNKHPKNTDILTYKHATSLEALIGYLDLKNNQARILEIMKYIVGE